MEPASIPLTLSFQDFMALEQVQDTSDFHCVTAWSKMDVAWVGVRFRDLMELVSPLDDAHHVMCHAYDGYTTNVELVECMKPDVLLVHYAEGAPLPLEHGGPVRMITPQLYAWKGAKWITRIELMTENRRGFWEQRGYSNAAHPWRNDRTVEVARLSSLRLRYGTAHRHAAGTPANRLTAAPSWAARPSMPPPSRRDSLLQVWMRA